MADQDPMASQCTATSKTTGNRYARPAIPGGSVCRFHGVAQLPKLRQPLRPVSGPWWTRFWVSCSTP
jgi:hypothetical protein